MKFSPAFESEENRMWLAICARRVIRHNAIGGLVFGGILLVLGVFALADSWLNSVLVLLGLLMLGSGWHGLRRPAVNALLAEAVVSAALFVWNLSVTILNASRGNVDRVDGHGLVYPLVAAIVFAQQYVRLRPLSAGIRELDAQLVKDSLESCKKLLAQKTKDDPHLADAGLQHRLKFSGDAVLCVQRNLKHVYSLPLAEFQKCITNLNKPKLAVTVAHPLGKIQFRLDKANSTKVQTWLTPAPAATAVTR